MHQQIIFLLISMFSISTSVHAQQLGDHRWKDRVLVVLAEKENNPLLRDQLEILKEDFAGVEERKLVVYIVLPSKFRKGLSNEVKWMDSKELHRKYRGDKESFEVILIGLDGGIKLRNEGILDLDKLFATIDQMPMRRAEMKRKTKEN